MQFFPLLNGAFSLIFRVSDHMQNGSCYRQQLLKQMWWKYIQIVINAVWTWNTSENVKHIECNNVLLQKILSFPEQIPASRWIASCINILFFFVLCSLVFASICLMVHLTLNFMIEFAFYVRRFHCITLRSCFILFCDCCWHVSSWIRTMHRVVWMRARSRHFIYVECFYLYFTIFLLHEYRLKTF